MVLLEVLLAVVLFALAAAVVGSALRSALQAAADLRLQAKAVNLTETVLSRLTTGELELAAVPPTPLEETDPEWTYEITIEPIREDPALKRVTVTVRNTEALRPPSYRLIQWMLELAPAETEEAGP